ncbi:hypothetical protein C0992_006172 [Termitomyces sp. T32_za158]|nr:hypothetical protein C0992_006172 [Termitomyces sp. T32_za158]
MSILQLLTVARSFVLRRDSTILKNVLPPKHEYVVFVTPTALQLSIFSKILHPDRLDDLIQSSTAESLALINILTKVSNSPILLKATADKAKADCKDTLRRSGLEEASRLIPEHAQIDDVTLSGAISEIDNFALTIIFVIRKITPAAKRQEFVNTFNKSSRNQSFIFLLSSKAGMAFTRRSSTSSKSDSFTRKDLRDIFRIDPSTPCNTHDLLECPCEGRDVSEDTSPQEEDVDDDTETEQGFVKACDIKPGSIDKVDRMKAGLAALGEWKHINCLRPITQDDIQDDALRKLIDVHDPSTPTSLAAIDLQNIAVSDRCLTTHDIPGGTVSYVFQKSSTTMLTPKEQGQEEAIVEADNAR